jgi:uncharacterized membrane protein
MAKLDREKKERKEKRNFLWFFEKRLLVDWAMKIPRKLLESMGKSVKIVLMPFKWLSGLVSSEFFRELIMEN